MSEIIRQISEKPDDQEYVEVLEPGNEGKEHSEKIKAFLDTILQKDVLDWSRYKGKENYGEYKKNILIKSASMIFLMMKWSQLFYLKILRQTDQKG